MCHGAAISGGKYCFIWGPDQAWPVPPTSEYCLAGTPNEPILPGRYPQRTNIFLAGTPCSLIVPSYGFSSPAMPTESRDVRQCPHLRAPPDGVQISLHKHLRSRRRRDLGAAGDVKGPSSMSRPRPLRCCPSIRPRCKKKKGVLVRTVGVLRDARKKTKRCALRP